MVKIVRILACGVTLAFVAHPALSQGIIFDTTDVKAVFAVGTVITYHTDSMTTSANIGAPGQSSWDFSGLVSSSAYSMGSVAVGSTPYAADFPQARFALYNAAFTYSFVFQETFKVDLLGEGYSYYGMQDGLLNYGLRGSGTAYLSGTPCDAWGRWLNSPSSMEDCLPLHVGSTWMCDFEESIYGEAVLPPPFTEIMRLGPNITWHSISYAVDAYGPLTLPGGIVRDALRIRKADSYNDGTTFGLRVAYIFLAKNGATVQVTLADPSATSGTVGVTIAQWTLGREDLPVPIELSSFTATRGEGDFVELKWITLSETDNYGFYVQKKTSVEGEFTNVPGGFVAGRGTTVVPQEYAFQDRASRVDGWWYRLKQVDLDGTVDYSEPVQVLPAGAGQEIAPESHQLAQNFPNPCNPTTIIRYSLSQKSQVSLTVHNALGQLVAVLQDGEKEGGYHEVKFDPSGLASGVYFYRLKAGEFVQTRKLLVVW